jgi:DNA-directed RNA polymerase subunit beta'
MSSDLDSVRLRLASPDDIRSWSTMDVLNAETLNQRTGRPVPGGLFCEDIFGDLDDTRSRRERMSHIELAEPVVHPLFIRGRCPLALLLDMKRKALLRVIYFQEYRVSDPGPTDLQVGQQLTDVDLRDARSRHGDGFTVEIGPAAIQAALRCLDLPALVAQLGAQPRTGRTARRLRLIEDFLASGNRLEWLLLEVVPVLPPELRPLGHSDLNELYQRIINRNNRLRKLTELNAPPVIIRNEGRMLQESVEALFDNASCRYPVRAARGRRMGSLVDRIQRPLSRPGKRVDYSARTVVVPGPELKLHQCGLPESIALQLYRPFLLRTLVELDHANNVESAWQLLARPDERLREALVVAMRDRPVLLSRRPVRDRLGIQAFEPVLIEGNAIRIHPLVCKGFNADFDGDQMAVHLPLSIEAQVEATVLMMSTNNIFSPANGNPIISPSQDIVMGCYYLTATRGELGESGEAGEGMKFANPAEVFTAFAQKKLGVHARIKVRMPIEKEVFTEQKLDKDKVKIIKLERKSNELVSTTVGRVLFNDILHDKMAFYDLPMTSKNLARIIADCDELLGRRETIDLLDRMKETGFRAATRSGLSIGLEDLRPPAGKERFLAEAEKEVERFRRYYERGDVTEAERQSRTIDAWTKARDEVTCQLFEDLHRESGPVRPLHLLIRSGAAGVEQLRQLAGLRGLLARPDGSILETPICASYQEGLSEPEYWLSAQAERLSTRARKRRFSTARSLTRRLARATGDVIVTMHDCGTSQGIPLRSTYDLAGAVYRPLAELLRDRISRTTIHAPYSEAVVVHENEPITPRLARAIESLGLEPVLVRSPLTCQAPHGVCRMCYGLDPTTGALVEEGTAVGILAAQSLGELGRQLVGWSFRFGSFRRPPPNNQTRKAGIVRLEDVQEVVNNQGKRIALSTTGQVSILQVGTEHRGAEARVLESFAVPHGAELAVENGQRVSAGQVLFAWDWSALLLLAEVSGTVRFDGLIEGKTLRTEVDSGTGRVRRIVCESAGNPVPRVRILDERGVPQQSCYLHPDSILEVHSGETVSAGTCLARAPRPTPPLDYSVGGLPRLIELLEMRRPRDPVPLAEVSGRVRIGERRDGQRLIYVQPVDGAGTAIGPEVEHRVLPWKNPSHFEGEMVSAGSPLAVGDADPADLLRLLGPQAARQNLAQQLRLLYTVHRLEMDDRHIETIVTQLLRAERPGEFRLRGMTEAGRNSPSFLASLLAGDVRDRLADAALRGSVDRLTGLTANILAGRLIPAGTGFRSGP